MDLVSRKIYRLFFQHFIAYCYFLSINLLNFVVIGTFLPNFIYRHGLLQKISQIIQSL